MQTFDAIIIGSGQAGTPLAKKLAKAGLKVLIIEKRLVGGTCINEGCTPTKALIASAMRAHSVATSAEFGIHTPSFQINFPAILERKNRIVKSFHDSAQKGLETTENLTLLFGEAYFTGPKTIAFRSTPEHAETYTATHIVIDTGASPSIPDIPGLKDAGYHISSTLLNITHVPEHLLIMGGSYIALEFGQMFRRLGSQVTIVDQSADFLSHEDKDIASCLKKILEDEGIGIVLGAEVQQVEKQTDQIRVHVKLKEGSKTLTCSELLVATGRTPQSKALQLEKAGVETGQEGYITVNEFLETSAAGVYAVGDVKGGPAFTHISYNDHLVLLNRILKKEKRSIKDRFVPYTTFTDPQLGRVGLTEQQALDQGLSIKVATLEMRKTGRGVEMGQTEGMMKAIVDAASRQILGVAILADQGGEIMSVLQMAMAGHVPYDEVREMIFAHPLYAESLNNLFMTLDPQ